MEKPEIIPIKNDIIFHDVINADDMDTIEWIVMQILGCNYEEIHGKVTVQNIRLTRNRKKERSKYVDLKLEYNSEIIIIELNCNYNSNPIRNIEYILSALGKSYDFPNEKQTSKKPYSKPVRGILVNLNWYRESANDKKTKIPGKDITLWNYPKYSKYDGYYLKIIDINLDFYSTLKYNSIKKEDKFFKLLTIDNKEELNNLVKDEKLLSHYQKRLIDLSLDKDYWEDIMSEEREEFFRKQNLYIDGYDAGIEEAKHEMILNLNNQHVPLEVIAKASELDIKTVQDVIENYQNDKENG